MRRFFKGGWSYDTCARLALRLFVRQPVTQDVIPPITPLARTPFCDTTRGVFRSGVGGRRKLKLPHRKHNKIVKGKLIYGGY